MADTIDPNPTNRLRTEEQLVEELMKYIEEIAQTILVTHAKLANHEREGLRKRIEAIIIHAHNTRATILGQR